MRFLFLLLSCVVAVLPLSAEEKSGRKGAHISFEQTEYDFGEVCRKGENRTCVFHFVNDGSEPLVVLSAKTSCSCLKADFSRRPIAVGERGEVRILLESKKVDKGVFRRVVQINSTSVGGAEILTIKGVSKD
jgi:hypothetical protein